MHEATTRQARDEIAGDTLAATAKAQCRIHMDYSSRQQPPANVA